MPEDLFPTSVSAPQILTFGNPGTIFYVCDVLQMDLTWCLFYFLFILAPSSEIIITCVPLITRGTISLSAITLCITRCKQGRFRHCVWIKRKRVYDSS